MVVKLILNYKGLDMKACANLLMMSICSKKKHKYTGSQPDKKKLAKIEDVIAVAEPALFSIYGDETVKKEMPYVIQKYKDKWFVHGYIPKNSLGGVFEIFIDAETSQIESVIHGE